ncbi:hypothetical protein HPB49_024675 [Dermacentor silvarum]|uniref:Uncharacterized protein n=1 Tax=Dermacentor silvarum TaxID=543639 RepID=A0ACB8D928_DERSI|nr:hypothetical protein HPB49_024675 [Dermacentor silvarum]
MMSVSLPGGGAPPQVQAPRGQHAYQQGAPQLQPRQRRVLEIKDPATGRNILDDIDSAPAETTPTASEQPSSSATDIAGMFAAQVAAAASSSGPPPTNVSSTPVLEPAPPPPPPVEEVAPHEEEVAAPIEERREQRSSPTPPPVVTAPPTELRGADEAASQGISTEAAESAAAPSANIEVAEVPACTEDSESAVPTAEVVDTRNSAAAEGRTPVVVDEVAPVAIATAAVTPVTKKEPEETPVAAVPAKTLAAVAAPAETTRETTDGESPLDSVG